jgi:hypothetical protein
MTVKLSEKEIVMLVAISFEFATLIAQLSGRVARGDGFNNSEEEDAVAKNCVNLQSMVAMVLQASPKHLNDGLHLSQAGRIIDSVMDGLGTDSQATA